MNEPNSIDDLKNILDNFLQILISLTQLHQLELYHSDLKPSNIVLRRNNNAQRLEVKLIDFETAIRFGFNQE